ncbi:MAG: ribonuclease HI [Bacillota bacterium]|jgi:ribonuclease HI
MKEVDIYSDGACSGNPGPGGWGCVLIYGQHRRESAGAEPLTTNQKMELKAALEGLKMLKRSCKVNVYSDSAYLINAFNQGWIKSWVKNGWQTSKKTAVENQDLWLQLLEQSERHQITWIKVKGHAGNRENEYCDFLARQAIKNL